MFNINFWTGYSSLQVWLILKVECLRWTVLKKKDDGILTLIFRLKGLQEAALQKSKKRFAFVTMQDLTDIRLGKIGGNAAKVLVMKNVYSSVSCCLLYSYL
jgi:hypothetical protein